MDIGLKDVLDTLQREPHIIREVLDTLLLRKKLTSDNWQYFRDLYKC